MSAEHPSSAHRWQQSPVTVLLVDDNALFRDGLAQILQRDGRFQVVGHAARGDEAVTAAARLRPALILMDLRMPGMSGHDAIRHIRATDPKVAIGVLTMFDSHDHLKAALDAGATGYLLKDATPMDLCEAAAGLAQGYRERQPVPGEGAAAISSGGALASLTARELQVLRLMATGDSNEAIARALHISPSTLRNHTSNIYRKLGISDRVQAVIVAVREGLVDVNPVLPSPG
jgi:two-component system, NarL family, response regulator DegU